MLSTLDVKLDGKKVTGTLTGPTGRGARRGRVRRRQADVDVQLQLAERLDAIAFNATLKDDGAHGHG